MLASFSLHWLQTHSGFREQTPTKPKTAARNPLQHKERESLSALFFAPKCLTVSFLNFMQTPSHPPIQLRKTFLWKSKTLKKILITANREENMLFKLFFSPAYYKTK